MAETSPNTESSNSTRKINLRILSPSPELSAGLDLPDTLLSSTVAQLKSRIQDAIPSHPPVERLRLICHGRVSRDAETIEEVLARAPVRLISFNCGIYLLNFEQLQDDSARV